MKYFLQQLFPAAWFSDIPLEQGYYLKCEDCDWIGARLKQDLSRCPNCGGSISRDAVMVLGCVIVASFRDGFYIWGIRSNADLPFVYIEPADKQDVADFIARRS
jgi:hypothetical protein